MAAVPVLVQSQFSQTVNTTSTVSLTTTALSQTPAIGNVMFAEVTFGDVDIGSSALTLTMATSGWTQQALTTTGHYSGVALFTKTVTSGDTGVISLSNTGGFTGDRLTIFANVREYTFVNSSSPVVVNTAVSSSGATNSASVTPASSCSQVNTFVSDAGTLSGFTITGFTSDLLSNQGETGNFDTFQSFHSNTVSMSTASQTVSLTLDSYDENTLCVYSITPSAPIVMVQEKSYTTSPSANTSGTISVPAFTSTPTIGDMMIVELDVAISSGDSSLSLTTPSGWTKLAGNIAEAFCGVYVFYKIATSGDTGAVSVAYSSPFSVARVWNVVSREWSGVAGISSSNVQATVASSLAFSALSPGFYGSLPCYAASSSGGTFTSPSGYTVTFHGTNYSSGYCNTLNLGTSQSLSVSLSTTTQTAGVFYFLKPPSPLFYAASVAQSAVTSYLTPYINDSNLTSGHTASGTGSKTLTANGWYTGLYLNQGHLLISHVCVTSNNHALTSFNPPSGWTLLNSYSIANFSYMFIMYKYVTSATENGAFSCTITSASSQICSYVIEVHELVNVGVPTQSVSQTTSAATMTCTLTASTANSLGIIAFMDSNSNGGSAPTFGGTATTWYSPPDQLNDTSGSVACYANFDSSTTLIAASSKSATSATSARTKPLAVYVVIPPYQVVGFNDSTTSTYSASGSGPASYSEFPSDTFSPSQTLHQTLSAANSLTQTDSFSSSNTQNVNRVNAPSDTAAAIYSTASQTQSVKNTVSQSDTFSSTLNQIQNVTSKPSDTFTSSQFFNMTLNAATATSDTAASASDSPNGSIVKLTSSSDTFSFSTSPTQSQSVMNSPSESFSLSSSLSQNVQRVVASSDVASSFVSALSQNQAVESSVSDSSSFSDSALSSNAKQGTASDTFSFSSSVSQQAFIANALSAAVSSFSDSVQQILTATNLVSQTDSFSSNVLAKNSAISSASDSFSHSDSVSDNVAQKVALSQTLVSFANSIQQTLSAEMTLSDEVVSLATNLTGTLTASNSVSNIMSFSDSPQAMAVKIASVSDSMAFSSLVNSTQNVGAILSALFSFANNINALASYKATEEDTAARLSDILKAQQDVLTAVNNSMSFSSAATQNVSQSTSKSDTFSFAGIQSAVLAAVQNLADEMTHGDSAAVIAHANAAIADALAFNDSLRARVAQDAFLAASMAQSSSVASNALYAALIVQIDVFNDVISYIELIVAPLVVNINLPITASVAIPLAIEETINLNLNIIQADIIRGMNFIPSVSLNQFNFKPSISISLPIKVK